MVPVGHDGACGIPPVCPQTRATSLSPRRCARPVLRWPAVLQQWIWVLHGQLHAGTIGRWYSETADSLDRGPVTVASGPSHHGGARSLPAGRAAVSELEVCERDDPPASPAALTCRGRARHLRPRLAVLALVVMVELVTGAVVGDALSNPGSDSAAAKLAEWGRDHGLGAVITWLESLHYQHNQPVLGGAPPGGIPAAAGVVSDPRGHPARGAGRFCPGGPACAVGRWAGAARGGPVAQRGDLAGPPRDPGRGAAPGWRAHVLPRRCHADRSQSGAWAVASGHPRPRRHLAGGHLARWRRAR